MSNKNDYTKSKEIWHAWRSKQDEDPIIGFCNWQIVHPNFKLECWDVLGEGPIIFQFWPNGEGYMVLLHSNGPTITALEKCAEGVSKCNAVSKTELDLKEASKKALIQYRKI